MKDKIKSFFFGAALGLLVVGVIGLSTGHVPTVKRWGTKTSLENVEKGLPPLSKGVPATSPDEAVVQLFRNGEFYCSAVVIGANYVATAAHCLLDQQGGRTIDVVTIKGKKITKARAVGIYQRTDIGLVMGDFSGEGSAAVENDSTGLLTKEVIGCGYPLGNKHLLCETLGIQGLDTFFVQFMGVALPGMSGGGVFNAAGKLVGLFSAAYPKESGGGTALAHVTGILGIFGIEP